MTNGDENKIEETQEGPPPRQETALVPAPVRNMARQIQAYGGIVEALGLPRESLLSLYQTLQNRKALQHKIQSQRRLSDNLRRNLIQSRDPISPVLLPTFDAFVRENELTYDTVTSIDGKPYPLAEGLRQRSQTDLRLRKSISIIQEQSGTTDSGVMWAKCVQEMIFWNGEKYQGLGAADSQELQTRWERKVVTFRDVLLYARTRAERDVYRKAFGLSTAFAEDIQDGQLVPAASYEVSGVPEEVPKNRGSLMAMARTRLGMGMSQVLSTLGVTKLEEITDFEAAWKKLQESQTEQT